MVLAMDEVVFCLYFFKLKVELITDAAITRLGFLDTKKKGGRRNKKRICNLVWERMLITQFLIARREK